MIYFQFEIFTSERQYLNVHLNIELLQLLCQSIYLNVNLKSLFNTVCNIYVFINHYGRNKVTYMFDESSALSIIDDTKPLTAIISETENNGSYIVSIKLETLNGFYVLQPFLSILIW